jgi:cytochrome P450
MMSQWVSHHDPSHFSNPESFEPARWSDENIKNIQGVPYFPFSKGIRSCAGEQFAEIQDTIILATIAQSINFTLCPGQNLSPLARRSDAPQEGILCTLAHSSR